MPHERQDLRDAVVTQLVAAGMSVGSRVYKTRMGPIRATELPAVCVYISDETVDPTSRMTAPREMKRTAKVVVEAYARATEDVDDVLDALALEVETAMDVDLNFDETAFDSVLTSTELGIQMTGDRPMGAVQLTYSVIYHSDSRVAAPEDDFEGADAQYSLAGDQLTADQAQDTIELETE